MIKGIFILFTFFNKTKWAQLPKTSEVGQG